MKFIIADSQFLTRKGIYSLLKEEFQDAEIKEIGTSLELLENTPDDNIEILIIDPDFFKLNDLVELSIFKKRNPETPILVLTDNKQYSFVRKILDTGIINIIFKNCDRDTFMEALQATLSKKKYFDEHVLDILISRKNQDIVEVVELTQAEKEIVRLIAQGLTTKEIASRKILSGHTINTHRKNIFRKLKINNSSELLMYAVKTGIIDTTEYYI